MKENKTLIKPFKLTPIVKYVYGVVPSRRLGKSLGVNVIPRKTCSYSCVYCQLGRTTNKTIKRRSFFPKEEILEEIVRRTKEVDFEYVTFVGEGEPTLCKDLGWLIEKTKEFAKVAVITNGSLLFDEDVRNELVECDVVIPSLDAADQKTFLRVNRPFRGLLIAEIVEGVVEFRKIFNGELNVEIMLVKGYNDSVDTLSKIRDALSKIKPDRVYIMSFTRPPAEDVEPVDDVGLFLARSVIDNVKAELITSPEQGEFGIESAEDLISVLRRHPMRREQIEVFLKILDLDFKRIKNLGVKEVRYRDEIYYIA
ncbi:radical SAM protein [Archaeoglobales archaeon]|nr:MAG: radical SAM protein [Archaeoglobales archaeon]